MTVFKTCQCETHEGKKTLAESNFYKSNSVLFPDGRANICKKCMQKMINYSDMETIYDLLRAMDIPFISDYWDRAVEKKPDNPFSKYITMANSMPQFRGLTYANSIFKSEVIKKEENEPLEIKKETFIDDEDKITKEELKKLKDKFGVGYPDEEYILFEKKYIELRPSFQLFTAMHEECLREYCIDKVKEGLAKARGDFKEAKDWAVMAKEQAQSGNLNPSQMSKSDLNGGLDTFGQMVRMVEQTPKGEFLKLLPMFVERPKDRVDVTLWLYVNYIRDIKGLEPCEYKDIYEFYLKRVKEYEGEMGDTLIQGETCDDLEKLLKEFE